MAIGTERVGYRFWTRPERGPTRRCGSRRRDHAGADPTPPTVHDNPFDLLGRDGDAGFDVVAFNIYSGAGEFEKPWTTDGVHRVQQLARVCR